MAKETGAQLNGSKMGSTVNCDGLVMMGGTSWDVALRTRGSSVVGSNLTTSVSRYVHSTTPRLSRHLRQLGSPPSHFWNNCQRAESCHLRHKGGYLLFPPMHENELNDEDRRSDKRGDSPALHACPTSRQCPSASLFRELNLARRFPSRPITDLPSVSPLRLTKL